MYEQPTPGRRFGPALIALLVVLAAMAGTMAYLVVHQIVVNQSAGNPGTGGTHDPTTTTHPTTPSPGLTGTTEPSTTTTTPAPADSGTSCPVITEQAVVDRGLNGGLTLLMYVRVSGAKADESDAEAWVCKNKDGILIYQGHVRSGPFTTADAPKGNTLLLVDGVKGTVSVEGDGYLAVNPNGLTIKTEYHVHPDELTITHRPSGRTSHYPVIGIYQPPA